MLDCGGWEGIQPESKLCKLQILRDVQHKQKKKKRNDQRHQERPSALALPANACMEQYCHARWHSRSTPRSSLGFAYAVILDHFHQA